ncbi:putative zinc finger protein [Apostichopus japonicus]|uniref:Putative zinc finger protein n=1 Tax=Stichopus japonicus TaxID=307972 RepID=A0A2G8L1H7_STIJA|nr:putative zinc finger protein [Apostichopus japonicus]
MSSFHLIRQASHDTLIKTSFWDILGYLASRQVGVGDNFTSVPNRIHLQSAYREWRKTDPSTCEPCPKSCSRGGNFSLAGKTGNCRGIGRGRASVLFLSNKKTGRILASHPKPKTPEQKLHRSKTFPHGNAKFNSTPTQEGNVGRERGPPRHLLAHTYAPTPSMVLRLPIRRKGIHIQSAPIRPVNGSKSVHKSDRNCHLPPQIKRSDTIRVPRRLAHSRRVEVRRIKQRTQDGTNPPGTGLDSQRNKVTTDPDTEDPVPGGSTRFYDRDNQSLRTEDRGSQNDHSPNPITTRVIDRDVAPSPGTDGQHGRRGVTMQTTYAPAATTSAKDYRSEELRQDSTDPPVGRNRITPTVVARHRELGLWGPLHRESVNDIGHDGRLTDRLGSPLEQPNSLGDVVSSRENMAYQHTRHVCCQTGSGVLPQERAEHSDQRFHGQHHCGRVHKPTRGTHSERLCRLACEVQMIAKDPGMTLGASNIVGKLNVMADALSRGQMDPNEWALSQETCNRIFEGLGRPKVDLLATAENAKIQIFCSRWFHPQG